MPTRRSFLHALTGVSGAAAACARTEGTGEDAGEPLERALRELNASAAIGIAEDDFELAKDYASGAYREAQAKLRPIVLDEGLDLPLSFAAKRGR